MSFMEHDEWVK
ncbi:putative host specificity protein J, partial [Escherichia coli 99.0672]